jgi:hypothetical protein
VGRKSEYEVYVRYPYRSAAEDETWLTAAATRHGGELSRVMECFPAAQRVWFQTAAAGSAFAGELKGTGRWEATLSPL